ncbi:hypothetical protein KAR91_03000 [Candidatus Pacearchaeota archaeon]|nr:hypothetical protein [Candidatus Pacearchaeota archaeon]
MTPKTKDKDRKFWAETVAGVKKLISKKQDELDKAGIQRKAIDLTPDIVDELRNRLCEAFPAMCEGEGEAVAQVMQVIVDALAEAQPESDVDEERSGQDKDDKQDEDEEDKDGKLVTLTRQYATLTRQYAEMGKAYNDLVEDVSEVVDVTAKVMQTMSAETKSYSDFEKRLAKIEKSLGERPRRASQTSETELGPESKLAKELKDKNLDLSDVPEGFHDMYGGAK